MLAFLNPLLLFGALAIAAPIIVHLLARRQIKRVPWAAMRFLAKAVERNQRRMTLEDILLLCLRCLLFLLLAFALARPALRKGSALAFRGRDEVAVILLDGSLSMAQTDGVSSHFEQAQQAAEQILDALPAGTPAAVWLVTDAVDRLTPEPTKDVALNRKLVRDAERTDRGSDWPAAVRSALEALSRQSASVKQLFIVTDGQAHGWKGVPEIQSLIKENGKGVLVHIVLTGNMDSRNVAATDVRLASALPAINEPLQFEAELSNFGPDEVVNLSLNIALDGGPAVDEQIVESLKPGAAKRVVLHGTFHEPGLHTVTLRHGGDRCAADDARTIALRLLDQIDVLLVDGEPGPEPRDSEVFYLRHALAPVPAETRDRYVIKARTIGEPDLASANFADFDTVVLANVVDLPPPATEALIAFVRSGGGLMVFPGSRTNVAFYNEQLHRDQPLLPATFGDVPQQDYAAGRHLTLQSQDYAHPIVALWNDSAAGSLATAQFSRSIKLSPGKGDAERGAGVPLVVVRYSNGEPALVERTFGAGRVLQFSSTADSAWNDLCLRPVFVPFIHRALGALITRHDDRVNLPAGAGFTREMPLEFLGKSVRVTRPGDTLEQSIPASLAVQDGIPRLSFPDTQRAGPYEVRIGDDAAPAIRFAAQFDSAESKLDPLTPSELKVLQSVAQITQSTAGANLRQSLIEERNGAEFWLPLAWITLGLAMTETLLGNRWSRSK